MVPTRLSTDTYLLTNILATPIVKTTFYRVRVEGIFLKIENNYNCALL